MDGQYGDSTRSVKATASQRIPGQPVAPPPVPASAYHLSPDESLPLDTYGRSANPNWRQLESALAELEGAASALTGRRIEASRVREVAEIAFRGAVPRKHNAFKVELGKRAIVRALSLAASIQEP